MTYAAVDHIIMRWAKENDLILQTQFGGHERRFCYVSAGLQECFQISIEPPEEGTVLVNVWSVETIDDVELHAQQGVPCKGLSVALDAALDQVRAWSERTKGPATR